MAPMIDQKRMLDSESPPRIPTYRNRGGDSYRRINAYIVGQDNIIVPRIMLLPSGKIDVRINEFYNNKDVPIDKIIPEWDSNYVRLPKYDAPPPGWALDDMSIAAIVDMADCDIARYPDEYCEVDLFVIAMEDFGKNMFRSIEHELLDAPYEGKSINDVFVEGMHMYAYGYIDPPPIAKRAIIPFDEFLSKKR